MHTHPSREMTGVGLSVSVVSVPEYLVADDSEPEEEEEEGGMPTWLMYILGGVGAIFTFLYICMHVANLTGDSGATSDAVDQARRQMERGERSWFDKSDTAAMHKRMR